MDWERYCESQELPEVCPICGKDNATEDGEWISKNFPGFCSAECFVKYDEEQRKAAEGMYEAYKEWLSCKVT